MKDVLLNKIRLSWYLCGLLVVYAILTLTLPRTTFASGALTLFSVNSFLYGFYIAPILSAQKSRIEELHRIVRSETNALFSIMLKVKSLPSAAKDTLQETIEMYIKQTYRKQPDAAEVSYEKLITYCLEYKGADKQHVDTVLDMIVANQQNRTLMNMQLRNAVYSNEWIVMFVLFSITLGFILFIDTGNQIIFRFVTAFLCTGLTMLLIVLVKLSTLTHKKAKQIYDPLKKLHKTKFYRFD